MKKTIYLLPLIFFSLCQPIKAQEEDQIDLKMLAETAAESLTSEQVLGKVTEEAKKIKQMVADLQDLMSDSIAMLYVSDTMNKDLPPLTETDLPVIKAALPEQLKTSAEIVQDIPDSFDIKASDKGIEVRITRHIGLNMGVAKLFAAGKSNSELMAETLSGTEISVDKFKKEKIGSFNTMVAVDENGSSFFITSAGPFLAVRIEGDNAAEARKVLNQMSPKTLMKAFKTDKSTVTLKQALTEAEKIKSEPDFNSKMYKYMQETQN